MKKLGIFAMTAVFAVAVSLMAIGPVAAEENPNASAKATAMLTAGTLINWTGETDGWVDLLANTIKTPNQKELFIDVALQCGLYTLTQVKSKNGVKDTSSADVTIDVRVLVDGVEARPGQVVYSRRLQTLSATLNGLIVNCLVEYCYDPDPDDPDNEDKCVLVIDPVCMETLEPEEIELILDTLDAHAFNFVAADLGSGVHTVEVQAKSGSEN